MVRMQKNRYGMKIIKMNSRFSTMENSTTGISWKSLRVNSMKCIRILTEINFKKFIHEKKETGNNQQFCYCLD